MNSNKEYLNGYQVKNGVAYFVKDMIAAVEEQKCKVIQLRVSDIFADYQAPCDNNILSFIEHMKDVLRAELKYPIILAPDNFILDGKHRLIKAKYLGIKYIKAYRLKEMPEGKKIVD